MGAIAERLRGSAGELRRLCLRQQRLILLTTTLGAATGLTVWQSLPELYYSRVRLEIYQECNPDRALADAERAIQADAIEFYFCGAIFPYAPGVPEKLRDMVRHYPQRVAGRNLGCSGSSDKDREYARLFNERMLQHLGYPTDR